MAVKGIETTPSIQKLRNFSFSESPLLVGEMSKVDVELSSIIWPGYIHEQYVM